MPQKFTQGCLIAKPGLGLIEYYVFALEHVTHLEIFSFS